MGILAKSKMYYKKLLNLKFKIPIHNVRKRKFHARNLCIILIEEKYQFSY